MSTIIELADFFERMDSFFEKELPKAIGVAVSGGADSLCLTLLANEWCLKRKVLLKAVTVDHQLRKESTSEAEFVHQLLAQKGISHTTLTWRGEKPNTAIEEKAREERYRLLLHWCGSNHIKSLLIAHHQNDQAETFLQHLMRSSGVDGLAGIQPKTKRGDIELIRPLLDFSRNEIQQTMKQYFHQDWVEDPSNQSLEYERARLRAFQSQLDKLGLTCSAIALSSKRLLRARQALEQITENFWHTYVFCHQGGFVLIDRRDFDVLPEEIALRVLLKGFAFVSGVLPRLSQVEKVFENLSSSQTVAGCLLFENKYKLYIAPEYEKLPLPVMLTKDKKQIWGRFEVLCNKNVKVAPLDNFLKVKDLPYVVQKTIPAFFDEKGLAFVPSLDYKRENDDIDGIIKLKE